MRIVTSLMLLALLAPAALAELPAGKVAVIEITAIHGLADFEGAVNETRETAFDIDGASLTIKEAGLSLDGVQTLLLINERRDEVSGGRLTRHHSQDVRALADTDFFVTDIPSLVLAYEVDMVAGLPALGGAGDQILCPGGANEPYHIWRVDGLRLMNRADIALR